MRPDESEREENLDAGRDPRRRAPVHSIAHAGPPVAMGLLWLSRRRRRPGLLDRLLRFDLLRGEETARSAAPTPSSRARRLPPGLSATGVERKWGTPRLASEA